MTTRHLTDKGLGTRIITGFAVLLAVLVVTAGPGRADDDREKALRTMPGYVDLGMLDLLDEDAKVEVNLRDPMLGLVSKFMGEDEPDLQSILAGLKLVRVRVYDLTPALEKKLLAAGAETTGRLDKAGWERIVRVREDGEHVDIYFKPSAKAEWIDGVMVIVVGDSDEAVFVNLVGTIRPEDVARLGNHLDIDGLDKVNFEN